MGARRRWLTALLAAAMVAVATPAQAHFTGRDAVDGNEIRYDDRTKWNDALGHAIVQWEAITGGVSIEPDTSTTLEDLDVADYSSSTDGYCGLYSMSSGADVLRLNDYYYNGASTTNRRACMLHEWGHAHGLGHSYSNQVMDSCPVCPTAYTVPQSHDVSDYNSLW